MKKKPVTQIGPRRASCAAIGAVLLCSVAGAQTRGTMGSARVQVPHMRPAARMAPATGSLATAPRRSSAAGFQGIRQATVLRFLPNGSVSSSFVPINSIGFGNANGVPGLGFDYSHLAAVGGAVQNNQNFRIGHGARHGQGAFVPVLFGGYPYYGDVNEYQDANQEAYTGVYPGYDPSQLQAQQPQSQPQVIVIQQPAAGQPGVDPGNYGASATSPTVGSEASAHVPDIGEFILVRRDGRILFASAFTVVGPQMQYVSPDGIRRTVPMTELDADATRQMNEARGTTVQITN